MNSESAIRFLHDFALILVERARDASVQCNRAKQEDSSEKDFACGRALGYYEVLSNFINQVEVFGIPKGLIGIEGVDADRLLM